MTFKNWHKLLSIAEDEPASKKVVTTFCTLRSSLNNNMTDCDPTILGLVYGITNKDGSGYNRKKVYSLAPNLKWEEPSRCRILQPRSEGKCRGVIFAIETGGHYWRNIAYCLDERGIPFRFINQFTLKRRREGKDLNRKKNDYRDSEVAAQLLCTGEFVESVIPML
jgi:hypothetical protein